MLTTFRPGRTIRKSIRKGKVAQLQKVHELGAARKQSSHSDGKGQEQQYGVWEM